MTLFWKAHRPLRQARNPLRSAGFTLLELVIVIAVVGAMYTLISFRPGSRLYWEREAFLRKLSETISFLHHRAISDGVFYRMEFHMSDGSECFTDTGQYCLRVGEIVAEGEDLSSISSLLNQSAGVGTLTLELAMRLNPSVGEFQNMIEPRSFPSLAKPIYLPSGASFHDVKTMRGLHLPNETDAPPYIMFSPRGFSEFAVIHFTFSFGDSEPLDVTVLVNPFTGLAEVYKEYKDFEWSYGRKKK